MAVASEPDRCSQTLLPGVVADGWKIHHASPFISVTLCRHGECEPGADNTVMIGIIHFKKAQPIRYRAHVLVISGTAPFRYRSISPALEFGRGAGRDPFVYITTAAWARPRVEHGLSHGFLDDEVLLTMGVNDRGGGVVSVRASELLERHAAC